MRERCREIEAELEELQTEIDRYPRPDLIARRDALISEHEHHCKGHDDARS